jgi:Protein of unknown function (DUF1684)
VDRRLTSGWNSALALRAAAVLGLVGSGIAVTHVAAQIPPSAVETERADYVTWLTTAATSPLAAVAQQPIGAGLRLGPSDADVPLDGIPEQRVTQKGGAITLTGPGGSRALGRGVPVRLGRYTLAADGPAGRAVLTVFGPHPSGGHPQHYDRQPALVFSGPLLPPATRGTVRVLGADGIEVDAAEAGSVLVPIGGARVRLLVRRLPTAGGEESELEIFFRDATNGHGTYPAGRFVVLVPERDGRYRLDFNRARNPFCAYSSAYPCPAPWRGNVIPGPIEAGERYSGTPGTER